MKSMNSNDDHHDPNNTNTNNNWLGFSLSSQIKMDIPHHHDDHDHHHHHHQTNPSSSATSVPSPSLFQSPLPHLNNYSIFYNEQNNNNNNGGLYSHHLPLKSDGSLCLMEALTKSQQAMVTTTTTATNSTPKLEDFFGGTNMGTHNYESNNREVMPLSLDSIYYNNAPNNTQNYHLNHQIHPQQQEFHYYHNNNNDSNQQQQVMMMGGISENGGVSSNRMTYGDLKSLTLSMSPGSQSSCINGGHQGPLNVTEISAMEMTKKRGSEKMEQKAVVHRKSIDTFGQRTSQYRGVTRHRWTGRYEAHLWDNSCKKEGQSRKGRQVYLGGYDKEEKAARAYDLAALKYWGPSTHINFPLENYQNELEEMKNMTRQEYVAHLRRKSSGFSRGASMYRGVTRHHQHGRWQARIGRVAGNKDLYLGTFSTQEEAAEAYDVAAIKFRGVNAVTNFDITRYNVERIMSSNTLLSGEMARRKPEAGFANVAASKNLNGGENLMSLYQSSSSSEQLHDVIRMNQRVAVEDLPSAKFCGVGKNHHIMSNASSLATSLTSSREGSPDRICATAEVQPLFALPCAPAASKVLYSDEANNNVGSWVPSTELRASLALPTQMPVFAAWTDA